MQEETISINGIEYVKKESVCHKAESINDMPYVIVRTYSAGVFAGYLKSCTGQEGVLIRARRIWFWDGAASLSQLAMEGTKKHDNCKFPCEVDTITLTQIVEILGVTNKAKKSIQEVKIWEM